MPNKCQTFRVPDLLQVQDIFRQGNYDRVVCSTELLMGVVALILKETFSVPAFFYLHTDWLEFAEETLGLDTHNRNRIRRLLRAFYRSFDGILILNSEQREWLAGASIGIPESRIFATAHWVEDHFRPLPIKRSEVFPGIKPGERVLLYAGRISEEKGVMLLPEICAAVKRDVQNVRIVIAGEGPALEGLKTRLPEAVCLGWIGHEELPAVYSASDLLVLPSRFDTFGCVVLEAMSCGLPTIAFNCKGPRDIISEGESGFLVESIDEFPLRISKYLGNEALQLRVRRGALARSRSYMAEGILERLMRDLGMPPLPGSADVLEFQPGEAAQLEGGAHRPQSFFQELLQMVGSA